MDRGMCRDDEGAMESYAGGCSLEPKSAMGWASWALVAIVVCGMLEWFEKCG